MIVAPHPIAQLCRRTIEHGATTAIDWDEILRLAKVHAVTPTIANAVRRGAVRAPEAVAAELDARRRAIAQRTLDLMGLLVGVLREFDRAAIRAVAVKGPVLAATAYGDVSLREFADLDILVRPSDVAAAVGVLGNADRRMSPALPAGLLARHVRADHELTFHDPRGEVELQWQVVPRFFAIDLDVDAMIARSGAVTVAGADLPSLEPNDLVLLVTVHAAKHLWERFAWVVDLDRVVATHEREIDWTTVATRARSAGALDAVRLGIAMADRSLSPGWTREAREVLGTERRVDRLADRLAARWFRERERAARTSPDPNFQPDLFRLHERPVDRLRHVSRWLVTPTDEDLSAVSLPRWATPAYVGVRLIRLPLRVLAPG